MFSLLLQKLFISIGVLNRYVSTGDVGGFQALSNGEFKRDSQEGGLNSCCVLLFSFVLPKSSPAPCCGFTLH